MHAAIIITCRMKSSRLPRKATLKIYSRTLVEHLIDRLKLTKKTNTIILATSTNPDDDILEVIAKKKDILCFRGSEKDKLQRYLDASKEFGFDVMVDAGGDNIFTDPECIDRIIEDFEMYNTDVVLFKDLPLGITPVGFNMKAVEKVCKMKAEEDTEAYGGYFFDSGLFKVHQLVFDGEKKRFHRPDIRLTMDYPEDLELVERIFLEIGTNRNFFPLERIIDLFEEMPKLIEINKAAQQKYLDNFKKLPTPKWKVEPKPKQATKKNGKGD